MRSADEVARAVLAHYPPAVRPRALEALGNRGGFSGARLWRGVAEVGEVCLRAWPPGETAERLAWRHRLMALARGRGLAFVPAVFAARDGGTLVAEAGRLWELQEWLPGRADYHAHPSPARLEAACVALARLHDTWGGLAEGAGACPALRRRREHLRQAEELLAGGPVAGSALAARALGELRRHLLAVLGLMERWGEGRGPLQPCLCDVWHDHLLYEGERLTGLVDYGAVQADRVAVDLARMLGGLVEDDEAGWRAGLAAYRGVRALPSEEEELARDLDRAGAVLAVANWLRRGVGEGEGARRLEALLRRVGRWR